MAGQVTIAEGAECLDFDSQFNRFKLFLGSSRLTKASEVYSSIYKNCQQNGCRGHLRDLHLILSDYFKENGKTVLSTIAFTKAYYFQQAAKSCEEAIGVEQNEFAVSSKKPIGTSSVGECVCLCLQQQATKKILVAHIDVRTSAESIDRLLLEFVTEPCKGYLIGGSAVNEELEIISRKNIEKVDRSLHRYSQISLTRRVLDTPHPTTFIFDLAGNLIEDVYPGKLDEQRLLRNAIAIKGNQRDIRPVYLDDASGSAVSIFVTNEDDSRFIKDKMTSILKEPDECSPVHYLEMMTLNTFLDSDSSSSSSSPISIDSVDFFAN
jgi:hypothetical protein